MGVEKWRWSWGRVEWRIERREAGGLGREEGHHCCAGGGLSLRLSCGLVDCFHDVCLMRRDGRGSWKVSNVIVS